MYYQNILIVIIDTTVTTTPTKIYKNWGHRYDEILLFISRISIIINRPKQLLAHYFSCGASRYHYFNNK